MGDHGSGTLADGQLPVLRMDTHPHQEVANMLLRLAGS